MAWRLQARRFFGGLQDVDWIGTAASMHHLTRAPRLCDGTLAPGQRVIEPTKPLSMRWSTGMRQICDANTVFCMSLV
jgi:hypothetical protein